MGLSFRTLKKIIWGVGGLHASAPATFGWYKKAHTEACVGFGGVTFLSILVGCMLCQPGGNHGGTSSSGGSNLEMHDLFATTFSLGNFLKILPLGLSDPALLTHIMLEDSQSLSCSDSCSSSSLKMFGK